jgi:hypothetical protein
VQQDTLKSAVQPDTIRKAEDKQEESVAEADFKERFDSIVVQ